MFEITSRRAVDKEEPAAFIISDLSVTPDKVRPSEEVTVTAVVTNIGDSEGSYPVVLRIDGAEEASKEVTLGAGQNEMVTFTIAKEVLGTYTVDIAGNTEQFTVALLPPLPN